MNATKLVRDLIHSQWPSQLKSPLFLLARNAQDASQTEDPGYSLVDADRRAQDMVISFLKMIDLIGDTPCLIADLASWVVSMADFTAIMDELRGEISQTDRPIEITEHCNYSNYPTFAVSLWIDNDEYHHSMVWGLALATNNDPALLASRLREYVTENMLGRSFFTDRAWPIYPFLHAAIDLVNWRELADTWIEAINQPVTTDRPSLYRGKESSPILPSATYAVHGVSFDAGFNACVECQMDLEDGQELLDGEPIYSSDIYDRQHEKEPEDRTYICDLCGRLIDEASPYVTNEETDLLKYR